MSIPVSVLIPCKDEEANIGYAIESVVGWADDVIVLDSGSQPIERLKSCAAILCA